MMCVIADALRRYGLLVTVRRRVGTTAAFQAVDVYAVVQDFIPQELVGMVEAGDMKVTIAPFPDGTMTGPPRKGDLVTVRGGVMAVEGVEEKALGADTLAYILHCRGA